MSILAATTAWNLSISVSDAIVRGRRYHWLLTMKHSLSRYALLALLLLPGFARLHAANIPGTSVDITPPADFEPAQRFAGFINRQTGASIAVSEIAGPFSEVTAGFTDGSRMQAQGMALIGQSAVEVAGARALLTEAGQSAHGVRFNKWILAIDRAGSTTLIVATYPQQRAAAYRESLRRVLLATGFGTATDPLQALGFEVTPRPPFKVARVIGQNLILAPDGRFPVADEKTPFIVVGTSVAGGKVSDRWQFAEARIANVATVDNLQVGVTEPLRIGHLDGLRTLATGTGKANGTPLTVYQVVLFDQSSYYLIQALTPSVDDVRNLPLFDAISESCALG